MRADLVAELEQPLGALPVERLDRSGRCRRSRQNPAPVGGVASRSVTRKKHALNPCSASSGAAFVELVLEAVVERDDDLVALGPPEPQPLDGLGERDRLELAREERELRAKRSRSSSKT